MPQLLKNYNNITPQISNRVVPKYNASLAGVPFSQSMTFTRKENKEPTQLNNTNERYFKPEIMKLQILEKKIKDMENDNKNDNDNNEFRHYINNNLNNNKFDGNK